MQVRTELSPVTSTSQSELEVHTTLFVCQELLHIPPVELLAAEKTLAQSEGVGRVKYLSHRAIQLKPSTFKDMLSPEVGKQGNKQGEGKKYREQFRSLILEVPLCAGSSAAGIDKSVA